MCMLFLPFCRNQPSEQATPKALQDGSSNKLTEYYTGRDNLIDELYREVVADSPGLQRFEEEIRTVNKNRRDSLDAFNRYHDKSQSYYALAKGYIDRLQDSLLKARMRELITASQGSYQLKISAHAQLMDSIGRRSAMLSDLHNMIKLKSTLHLIEQFQDRHQPSLQPLKGFDQQLIQTITHADSLVKK